MNTDEIISERSLLEEKPDVVATSSVKSSKKQLFLGVAIGALACAVIITVGVYLFLKLEKKPVKTDQQQIQTVASQVTPVSTLIWLEKPQEISPIPVFKKKADLPQAYLPDEAKFFKVAELPDGSSIINVFLPVSGPSEPYLIRFLESKDKKYTCFVNYLNDWMVKEVNKILLPEVSLESREIEGLVSPETIEVGDKKFVKIMILNKNFDVLKNPQKILDTQFGPIYEDVQELLGKDEIYSRGLYLKLKDNTLVSYKLKVDFYSDNGVPEIFLNENPSQKNQTAFTQRLAVSCSLETIDNVPIIKDGSPLISGKKEIGKTSSGDPIYQVFEPTNELVKILYKNYSESRAYFKEGPSIETIEQMANNTNHFLWRDPLGDWQIFQNTRYETMAECGKPVIYLYPTQKTEVSIKIGALIRKSEPSYGESGWNVLAYPDGKIVFNGQQYDSLFWEGLGDGLYPNLRDYGFVIPQKELLTTLKNHLSLLGLNQKESADFLEFWWPKMPKTPYVRLTWFGTKEMDMLAPLEVIPQPDTKIRIFLDFEGLEKPKFLIPQKLSSVKRVGFTLVEWGGLLTGHLE